MSDSIAALELPDTISRRRFKPSFSTAAPGFDAAQAL
jgi:hypothetical protein